MGSGSSTTNTDTNTTTALPNVTGHGLYCAFEGLENMTIAKGFVLDGDNTDNTYTDA